MTVHDKDGRWRTSIATAAQCYFLLLFCAQASSQVVKLDGTPTCFRAVDQLSTSFVDEHPAAAIDVQSHGSYSAVEQLGGRKIDIAVVEYPLREYVCSVWDKTFPKDAQPPAEFVFAQSALGVVVHKNNPVTRLTIEQLRDIYSGKIKTWNVVGGANGPIKRIALQPSIQLAGNLMSDAVLDYRQWDKSCRNLFTDANVIAVVASDPQAIGFVALTPALAKDVRLIAIAKDKTSEAVAPTVENIVLEKYPVVRQFRLVLTDSSSGAAFDFANYLCSDKSQKAVEEWGLFPAATRKKAEANQRLAEVAAGRGVPVLAVGSGDQPLLFSSLAVEYVKAKKAIQWRFHAAISESSAVSDFVSGGSRELLFLPARLDDPHKPQNPGIIGKK